MITIQMARNGWIVRDKQDEEIEHVYVFSDGDTDKDAIDGFVKLLWTLNDLCGPTTSRYSPHRIQIKIEPGDKWEGDDHESLQSSKHKSSDGKDS